MKQMQFVPLLFSLIAAFTVFGCYTRYELPTKIVVSGKVQRTDQLPLRIPQGTLVVTIHAHSHPEQSWERVADFSTQESFRILLKEDGTFSPFTVRPTDSQTFNYRYEGYEAWFNLDGYPRSIPGTLVDEKFDESTGVMTVNMLFTY